MQIYLLYAITMHEGGFEVRTDRVERRKIITRALALESGGGGLRLGVWLLAWVRSKRRKDFVARRCIIFERGPVGGGAMAGREMRW